MKAPVVEACRAVRNKFVFFIYILVLYYFVNESSCWYNHRYHLFTLLLSHHGKKAGQRAFFVIVFVFKINNNFSPLINVLWIEKWHLSKKQIHQYIFNFKVKPLPLATNWILDLWFCFPQWKTHLIWIWREMCTHQAACRSVNCAK